MSDIEAKPTRGEPLTKDTLMNMQGEYYSIKDTDGKESKVHVDRSTKLDKVVVGNKVKAYVTGKGHTMTLLRGE